MAIETLILLDSQVSQRSVLDVLGQFAQGHGAVIQREKTRMCVSVWSGLYISSVVEGSAREFYWQEYKLHAMRSIVCRADKNLGSFAEFDVDCLAIAGLLISLEPSANMLMLKNWEACIMKKEERRIILHGLRPERYETFLSMLPNGFDVEIQE